MKIKFLSLSFIILIFCYSFSFSQKVSQSGNIGAEATSFSHPSWSEQSNIYEVNVRQYSKEGTFKAFEKSLPRLKKMGVQILWFMPINPIGIEGRKMTESDLGSYYSVKNYKEVNPEFGTMADWKQLVKRAHALGFKVIIDWVPNHTSPDNPWMKTHPDFYKHDKNGNTVYDNDYSDTRNLNYDNMELRDSMISAMKFWITTTGIDGFRCDHVDPTPVDFWKDCITQLRKIKNVFMLAESEKPEFHYAGFDATYAWNMMWTTVDLAQGKIPLQYLDSVLNNNFTTFPKNAERMYFTTNHDENSWNGTEFEKYGDAYKAFAVFSQTMYESVPLVYSGQEEPNKKRLKFFTRDPITWGKYAMAPFYSTLLHLRSKDPALAADAAYKKITTANDEAIFAYTRTKGTHKIFVVLNLSDQPQHFTIKEKEIYGYPINVFTNKKENLFKNHVYTMKPWGYLVYEY
ncbi:MAG: alpha-glucosidase C-terminal domain-containing protein [Bacteroidota bacterium]|nr:alpha-glucosidase C-terminal domain-containing protein [Bacteroidota bacterium]